MISWFYSMIELAKSKLPWPGSDDKEETIRLKRTLAIEEICTEMPNEFISIYNHIIGLQYEDSPDYDLIISYLNQALSRENIEKSLMDWEQLNSEEIQEISSIPLTTNEDKAKNKDKAKDKDKTKTKNKNKNANKKDNSESTDGMNGKGGCCTIC